MPNGRGNAPNKMFFGATGNPAKKGITGLSQVSKMHMFDETGGAAPVHAKPDLTGGDLITKRTEYLELQERRLAASLNETRSDTNRVVDTQSAMLAKLEKLEAAVKTQGVKLFQSTQVVYGKASALGLRGFPCSFSEDDDLSAYASGGAVVDEIATDGQWVCLVFPQRQVTVEGQTHTLMRCKTVDGTSGQLSLQWALVFEADGARQTRFIEQFDLCPPRS